MRDKSVNTFDPELAAAAPRLFAENVTIGYDNRTKKYQMTWRDTMTTSTMIFEGTADATGKVITFTGEVFVFGAWAGVGDDLVAELAGRVEGGFAIRAADLGGPCPQVAVERSGGAPVTLPAPATTSLPVRPGQ